MGVTQRVVSRDLLQDSANLSGDGNGQVGGADVVRLARSAKALELWVEVSAVGAGFDGDFILETRLEGGTAWYELAKITLTEAAIGTPPKAYASAVARWGETPLGQYVRGRHVVRAGDVTAQVSLIRRE